MDIEIIKINIRYEGCFMFYIDFYLFDGNYGKICILEYLFIENILFKLK